MCRTSAAATAFPSYLYQKPRSCLTDTDSRGREEWLNGKSAASCVSWTLHGNDTQGENLQGELQGQIKTLQCMTPLQVTCRLLLIVSTYFVLYLKLHCDIYCVSLNIFIASVWQRRYYFWTCINLQIPVLCTLHALCKPCESWTSSFVMSAEWRVTSLWVHMMSKQGEDVQILCWGVPRLLPVKSESTLYS